MKLRFPLLHYIVTTGCLYTWQSMKNCVRILIGRGPYSDEHLVFFRQYVLHRLGLRRIWAVTCTESSVKEGAGSLASLAMCTINFARVSGLAYLHSPLSNADHADRPMQQWAAAWESLFNLGAGEEPCNGRRRGVIDAGSYSLRELDLCFGLRYREKELLEGFRALIPDFRHKYYLDKSPRTTDEVTIAVHIRRGDVSADENSYLYTSTAQVLRMASEVKSTLESHKVPFNIRIYSQGDVADFAELLPLGVEFFLDADPIWTIQELIEADILILSKGNFSYCAGVISDGIKICEPYLDEPPDGVWQMPNAGLPARALAFSWPIFSELETWIPCQLDGTIDRTAFERQLTLLLQAKEKARTTGSSLASR
jgi:hypothetical protein